MRADPRPVGPGHDDAAGLVPGKTRSSPPVLALPAAVIFFVTMVYYNPLVPPASIALTVAGGACFIPVTPPSVNSPVITTVP